MRIRSGRRADLNDVAELWEDCGLVPAFRGFRNELQRKLLRDPDLFVVAVEDGRVLGAATGGFDGRVTYVGRMAVHPDIRRQGIGRQLVAELRRRLAAAGAPPGELLVMDDHAPGRAFWEGLGYAAGPPLPTYTPALPGSEDRAIAARPPRSEQREPPPQAPALPGSEDG